MILKEVTKSGAKPHLRAVAQSKCFRADIDDIAHDIWEYISDFAIRVERCTIHNTSYCCGEEKIKDAISKAIDIFERSEDTKYHCIIDMQSTEAVVANLATCSCEEFMKLVNSLVAYRNSNAPRFIMFERSAAGNNMIMEVGPVDFCADNCNGARERAYKRILDELRARS